MITKSDKRKSLTSFRRRFRFEYWLLPCIVSIILYACSSYSPNIAPSPTRLASPTQLLGSSNCQPPSPITSSGLGQPEVQGTTSGQTQLWALLFSPMISKQELKIVWRMTGDGNLQIIATGPQGKSVKPEWIAFHGLASNWNRPGAEWGTGFTLPLKGCWDFHVRRGSSSGDVWFLVI